MYYQRITSDGNDMSWLKELERRIANLESPPAGSITIRDTITTIDPVTGAQTQFGTLPDGTRGFQPFIYDITPPPVATAPVAKAEPGVIIISWDGLFANGESAPLDFECCNIIGHKIVNNATALSVPVGMTRRPLDITFVQTDVAAIGEEWEFSLEAEDYNGNRAAWSARSNRVTMQEIVGEVDLSGIQADIDAAAQAASDAQTAAATAQQEADEASAAALAASNLANSKGKVIIQSAAPAAADQLAQNLWIDTTNGANTPKRWDTATSAWVAVTDKAAIDAAAAAATAQSKADQAFNNAATAATAAGTAQATADLKNRVWYSATAPAGTGHKQNDIWFDTANDNRINKWNATTLLWEQSLIGNNAIIANLDAGKITAGFIAAARIQAKSIGVDKLVITSTDNLIVEADFGNNGSSWATLNTVKTINATAGQGGLPAFRVSGSTALQTLTNQNNKPTVSGEERFRGTMTVRSDAALAAGAIKLRMNCFTTASVSSPVTIASSPLLVANTWTTFGDISPVLPAGTIAVTFFIEVTNPTTTAITLVDNVAVTRAADGKIVVDGTVTAKKLEAELALVSKIIAGDPTGTRAQMDPTGFRVFAYNPNTPGIASEVVRMGVASTDDYFAISKADGTLAASIDQNGVGSFTEVNATNKLYYKGEELGKLLTNQGGGIVGAAIRTNFSAHNAYVGGPYMPYLRLDVTLQPYRLYKIWCSPVPVGVDAGAGSTVAITYGFDSPAAAGSTQLVKTQTPPGNSGRVHHGGLAELFAYADTAPSRQCSFLVVFGIQEATSNGQIGIRADPANPVRLVVEDMGPTAASIGIGVHMDGVPQGNPTPPPPPAVQTYVKQYGAIRVQSYDGNGNAYNNSPGLMYQGLSPSGFGNLKSLANMADWTADLAGSSINYIRVYFNFTHWYYNSGGTARICVSDHTGLPYPHSWGSGGVAVTSGGWPKPGARWVDIPAIQWDSFKSGQWRSIGLEGDGTFGTYGIAEPPIVEISYNK